MYIICIKDLISISTRQIKITQLKNKTKWYISIYFNSTNSSSNFVQEIISHKIALPNSIQIILYKRFNPYTTQPK